MQPWLHSLFLWKSSCIESWIFALLYTNWEQTCRIYFVHSNIVCSSAWSWDFILGCSHVYWIWKTCFHNYALFSEFSFSPSYIIFYWVPTSLPNLALLPDPQSSPVQRAVPPCVIYTILHDHWTHSTVYFDNFHTYSIRRSLIHLKYLKSKTLREMNSFFYLPKRDPIENLNCKRL